MDKIFAFLILLAFFGCPTEPSFVGSKYKPVILKRADFEKSVVLENSRSVEKSAKIYIFDKFIFINDKHKGFHVFNNTDATKPTKEKFLRVPGATDIAIRNNTMYINQATDLIALTFNPSDYSYKIEKRVKNVFPPMISPDGFKSYDVKDDEVIVNWVLK